MRRDEESLRKQVAALNEQIAALRVQSQSLAVRNRQLEETAQPAWILWMLIALAVLAIAMAGWMAWRYTQLRKALEGSPWWGGATIGVAHADAAGADDDRGSIAVPTRAATVTMGPPGARAASRAANRTDHRSGRGTESRSDPEASDADAAPSTSSPTRSRPVRNVRYASSIDTDFTVSDIEAAMATVRTVSRPRREDEPESTDYAALGGPTIPSPFADPPASAPAAMPAPAATSLAGPKSASVDFDIPPLASAAPAAPARKAPSASSLDFRLDLSDAGSFDPLATDGHKRTVVDATGAGPLDIDLSDAKGSVPLDFELPPTDATRPPGSDANQVATDSRFAPPERHGVTALDDLFSLGGPGPDTILALDERDSEPPASRGPALASSGVDPLTPTEVDRLLATDADGSQDQVAQAAPRLRLARFADLVAQVDEIAAGDPLEAISLLRQYVLRDERIPTLLWLRLFELYRQVGKRPVYEALAEHFARRYRRPMAGWNENLSDRVAQTPLAAMTTLDAGIEARWATDEGLEQLRAMLCDRDQPDDVVLNAVLQRDLLGIAKVYPLPDNPLATPGT